MSILQNLTEGVVNRDLSKEGEAILNKWEKTGLLEGLEGDFHRNQMAVLLENQAKELLRESNTMAGGDVEGFAAVAFPIVRRVFGGLLAQKLVSVQPMSLPSGLVFFMDFVKQAPSASRDGQLAAEEPSVYGGSKVAKGILDGVNLNPDVLPAPQFQNLVHGHSAARGVHSFGEDTAITAADTVVLNGAVSDADALLIDFDADLLAITDSSQVKIVEVDLSVAGDNGCAGHPLNGTGDLRRLIGKDARHVSAGTVTAASGAVTQFNVVRRLSKIEGTTLTLFLLGAAGAPAIAKPGAGVEHFIEYAMADNITEGGALGAVVGSEAWEMEGSSALPEIAIKVDSSAITAVTRKLKASWTPELAQDLNAYHNLDAEVELTGILSEQIALEIDQEILSDLIAGASASKLYWSRRPGLFVNRLTGADATSLASPPDFTGSVSEWYETLIETINDVSADIHRKTLRGGANFLVCGPEVANILEFTSGFRASVTHDDATGSVGAVQIGSINKKWDLHVDPYFPRNVILVGRKGGSFLESGFVYAPYVPLQVTPTIFNQDDFTPRKAVMTRYGKKMVRPDMYGLVICRDLEG
tara:strand:- start:8469 stop:10223 length:1755 start_codon:yes stop_codon:yes gene_type:complete